jgi:hypothetical protein
VRALTELCEKRGWELNVVAMERLSKEEQLAVAARTTVSTVRPSLPGSLSLTLRCLPPVPRRRPREWPDSFDHDAHNPDLVSHRNFLPRGLRA